MSLPRPYTMTLKPKWMLLALFCLAIPLAGCGSETTPDTLTGDVTISRRQSFSGSSRNAVVHISGHIRESGATTVIPSRVDTEILVDQERNGCRYLRYQEDYTTFFSTSTSAPPFANTLDVGEITITALGTTTTIDPETILYPNDEELTYYALSDDLSVGLAQAEQMNVHFPAFHNDLHRYPDIDFLVDFPDLYELSNFDPAIPGTWAQLLSAQVPGHVLPIYMTWIKYDYDEERTDIRNISCLLQPAGTKALSDVMDRELLGEVFEEETSLEIDLYTYQEYRQMKGDLEVRAHANSTTHYEVNITGF